MGEYKACNQPMETTDKKKHPKNGNVGFPAMSAEGEKSTAQHGVRAKGLEKVMESSDQREPHQSHHGEAKAGRAAQNLAKVEQALVG